VLRRASRVDRCSDSSKPPVIRSSGLHRPTGGGIRRRVADRGSVSEQHNTAHVIFAGHRLLVIVTVLVAAATGGCGNHAKSQNRGGRVSPAIDVGAWTTAATVYAQTMSNCERRVSPARGFWSDCAGSARRGNRRAVARVTRELDRLGRGPAPCQKKAAVLRRLITQASAALDADFKANADAFAAADRGRPADRGRRYQGPSPLTLDDRAQRITRRNTSLAPTLARSASGCTKG